MGDQGDSSPVAQCNDRDVASLRISDIDNNQALVVRQQGHTAAIAVQRLPNTSSSHFQQGTGNNEALQEQLHQLQHQIEGILSKMQQIDQQTQHAQQQMQDQIDKMLQTLQQMDLQHTEQAQQMTQMSDRHRQQLEEVFGTSQQQQQQIELVQQQLDEFAQDSRQQMHTQQQTQQQIDKVLNNAQQLDQKVQRSEQQHKQLLQLIRGMGRATQEQGRLPLGGHQETQYALTQFVDAQRRVQAVLAKFSPNLPIPRLFIILPAPPAVVNEQESCQLQFRLYFLCECGAHTMAKDCNKSHEIHLANHPGYDLVNQDEFINRYRPYLLTMMYMVKYGITTRGLVVPPLLGLNNANGKIEDIGESVDDTIRHLRDSTECIDGDTTAHQCLDVTEFAALKSHLRVKDGEGFSGGLSQMEVEKEHYSWICGEHLRECYESTLQQLRYHINTSGGIWYGNEVKVKVTSGATTQRLYHDLTRLLRIQNVENWRSITEIDLKQGSYQSRSSSTTDVLNSLNDPPSLSMDFGRFTMVIKDIFRGEVKDTAIFIKDLCAPTLDDLEFIRQCRPTALTLSETPHEKDDHRLVSVLQRNLSIASLQIECDIKRLITFIDLVKSTREKIFQAEDKSALRDLELVHPEIKVKVSFSVGSSAFDVESCIKMENRQLSTVDHSEGNFIHQYGWSITTFVVPGSFNDTLAKLLDESTHDRGSKIVHLDMTPTSLTTPGLGAMNRVINRSQGLTNLRMSLESLSLSQGLQTAKDLLAQHKGRLTSLHLKGHYIDSCLFKISDTFPRDMFPVLEEFFAEISGEYLYYDSRIKSMVSAPRQQQQPSLKALGMNVRFFNAQHWTNLIKAIDLSALEELHFNDGSHRGFTQVQLKTLVDHIADSEAPSLPLRLLNLTGITLDKSASTCDLFARLRAKVPEIKIVGVDS